MTDITTPGHPSSYPVLDAKGNMRVRRSFDAPRALVFAAFAEQERLVHWFGPRAFPVVSWTHDFRPGGHFEYVMEGPGGVQAPGGGDYLEIVEDERIVSLSRVEMGGEVVFEVRQTIAFADAPGGGTELSLDTVVLVNRDFPGLAGMAQGWDETLDRLEEHVAAAA